MRQKTRQRAVLLPLLAAACAAARAGDCDWTHHSGDVARTGMALRGPAAFNKQWAAQPNTQEQYVHHASPVVFGPRVFVTARVFVQSLHIENVLIAYDASSGARLWSAPLEPDAFDSYASPAVDRRNASVITAVGFTLSAHDAASGALRWQAPLPKLLVNASPAVTTDLSSGGVPANRAIVVDFDGFGSDATLWAINVDPFHPQHNPFEPGEVAWSAPVKGASGNSAACADGAAYFTSTAGVVTACDARTGALLWGRDIVQSGYGDVGGFFGGVTLTADALYAATYNFYGGSNNSRLFKFRRADGAIVWAVPCERTNSTPVVDAGGRIFLAGGIDGFGSNVRVQAFQDLSTFVLPLWDTFAGTGGQLRAGGWTAQPALVKNRLYVGRPAQGGGFFGPYVELYALDVTKNPGQAGFVAATYPGAGGNPALARGMLYSLGSNGLTGFSFPAACLADVTGDGMVGQHDLGVLLSSLGAKLGGPGYSAIADLDCDGVIGQPDVGTLLSAFGGLCP